MENLILTIFGFFSEWVFDIYVIREKLSFVAIYDIILIHLK